ncbi:alpha-amylase [Thermotomaculum hydrothermale]|uniref:Alpha-amylase n=1 Tax=Thermotomaculum hydrothermale TaxID=981385 RepID=A0A7R6T014_9BACT|nr:alpha-amylase/4-alpha-glucanotransferase domain-containing protein [Thermotomaculum hydrothermale]BBB33330.1 alpha-amylase [Thermotomaculum hydrothermale]
MARKVKFILCLHSHQPVGNLDYVFKSVYRESYLPFLKEFEKHPDFPVSLHYSGPLLEWLEENTPEYFELLNLMVKRGQVELIGGAFYEPILSFIKSKDRIDQIKYMQKYLFENFNCNPDGFWLAERVWEQGLVYDMAKAGVKFTMVDHTHFLYAGFNKVPSGYYVAEDRGKFVYVFPLNEKLRYLIPFKPVNEVLDYLKTFLDREEDEAIIVYGDDGEKFGSWPGTFDLIYKEKWLSRFINECLKQDWLEVTTFERVLKNYSPQGLCYLPDASYREMMEWALYPDDQQKLEDLYREFENRSDLARFIRGGSYRNFRKKYPESLIMYSRMIDFSNNCQTDKQRQYLLKSQCNCAYWHGVFGGIYLPHLRNAVFENIIKGENLLFEQLGVEIVKEEKDINFDGKNEVILWNRDLKLIFEPHRGGRLISLDLVPVGTNIQSTFTRQKEFYHRYVFEGGKKEMVGVHDTPALKEPDLDKYLVYDKYQRLSFIEHKFNTLPSAEDIEFLNFEIDRNFIERNLNYRICKRKAGVEFLNSENQVEKKVELKDRKIEIEYNLEHIASKYFAVEFNLFTLSPDAPDKYFQLDGGFVGNAGVLFEGKGKNLSFKDEWRGFEINFSSKLEFDLRIAPLYTVNLSESGIERVFQNSTIFLIFKNNKGKINLSLSFDFFKR